MLKYNTEVSRYYFPATQVTHQESNVQRVVYKYQGGKKIPIRVYDYAKVPHEFSFYKYDLSHLHVKLTQGCNCHCKFCSEHGETLEMVPAEVYIKKLKRTLDWMKRNKLLYSVSVTGGEPTLLGCTFKDISALIKTYNVPMYLNTNGSALGEPGYDRTFRLYDGLNVSRHNVADGLNFSLMSYATPSADKLRFYCEKYPIRIRAVVLEHGINLDAYLEAFPKARDFSFRALCGGMSFDKEKKFDHAYEIMAKKSDCAYRRLIRFLTSNAGFCYQWICDHYEYAEWSYRGKSIITSSANMEATYSCNDMAREFILHPNGRLGAWWKEECASW